MGVDGWHPMGLSQLASRKRPSRAILLRKQRALRVVWLPLLFSYRVARVVVRLDRHVPTAGAMRSATLATLYATLAAPAFDATVAVVAASTTAMVAAATIDATSTTLTSTAAGAPAT